MSKERNSNYNDFSNRTSFNGVPCREDEMLVPAVLNDEMKITLKPAGLNYDYVETWHFRYANEPVYVVFVPCKKWSAEAAMKIFNQEVSRLLKHADAESCAAFSIDQYMEDYKADPKNKYKPSPLGTRTFEEAAAIESTLKMLIRDMENKGEHKGEIVKLKSEGFNIREILETIDLKKGKTQGYAYIKQVLEEAYELYIEKYSD